MPLLCIENLTVTYRTQETRVTAVEGVSFTIESGEIFALVGESGSGKSSAALALTRLLPEPPAELSGRVLLDGADLMKAAPAALRAIRGGKISYVFQEPATSLNPVLTVGEQLLEAITLHTDARGRAARAMAIDWLARVGIGSAAQRLSDYPHEFSGGMQQRLMIAMALATQPALLIADEPTTALDVTVQVQILRLLRDLQRSLHLALLLITHDLLVVERLAHRLGVMHAGRVVELGPTARVLHHPTHPYTQRLARYRYG